MSRRSKEVRGYVNFPMNDLSWQDTGEGGMFVRLVVCEEDVDFEDKWMICCGGYHSFLFDESFVGDDVHVDRDIIGEAPPPNATREELDEWFQDWNVRAFGDSGNFHFPSMYAEPPTEAEKKHYGDSASLLSAPYLATINLGSTDWSGYNDEKGMWKCTYQDLTDKGKNLYDTIKDLYGDGCGLYLQTWLDT